MKKEKVKNLKLAAQLALSAFVIIRKVSGGLGQKGLSYEVNLKYLIKELNKKKPSKKEIRSLIKRIQEISDD